MYYNNNNNNNNNSNNNNGKSDRSNSNNNKNDSRQLEGKLPRTAKVMKLYREQEHKGAHLLTSPTGERCIYTVWPL
jgi:hypothetical protein